jgi:PEP-CTERM motif
LFASPISDIRRFPQAQISLTDPEKEGVSMSHKLRLTVMAFVFICFGSVTVARADTVTFATLGFGQMTYVEAGMTVASSGGLFGTNTGVAGSRNLAILLQNSVSFTFGGGVFDALNIEVNVFADNGPSLPPNTATFMAFNGANLTGMFTLVRNPGDPQPPLVLTFGAGFQGITRFVIASPVVAGQIHVDNFNFQPAGAVPEPATLLLMAFGLAGLAAKKRHR